MGSYVRIFAVANVAKLHRDFLDAIRLARQIEQTYVRGGHRSQAAAAGATLRELQRAYADFNRDLDRVAKDTATRARKAIRAELALTRVRPDTGNGPHLRDAIRARPLDVVGGGIATGAVGVADIAVLDQLVDPRNPQYGAYWRSQEYGYRFRGKQRTGVIGGFFTAGFGAGPFPAESRYAGNPGGIAPHPLFAVGKAPGAGLVHFLSPLRPRRFIERGANASEAVWRANLARIEQTQHIKLAAITSPAAKAGRRARRP